VDKVDVYEYTGQGVTKVLRQALATARLTRLITQDTITDPLRDQVSKVHPMVDELVHCPWCAGVWAAGAILLADRTAPALVDTLALAQAGSMVGVLTERMFK
jgi:hypothetical protein